jgi:hypothetical protein
MDRSLLISTQSIFCLTLICLVAGCATPGTSGYQYREPVGAEAPRNEAVVKLPFSDTWDLLIGQLAKSFFAINNVEKASRIINLSFSTDKPEDFIDCGTTERSFKYGDQSQNYVYKTAASTSYKTAGKWGPFQNQPSVGSFNRRTSLEGRVNIYVAPKNDDTIVTVNARYILTSRVSGQQEDMNVYGNVVQRSTLPEQLSTISFNTGQIGSADMGTPQEPRIVKCRSTGKLEGEILAMTKP